jgi:uncharacterized membrane protein
MFSLFFFARLTFVCGLFFGASWALLFVEHGLNPDLTSTILTLGFGLGAILLPLFSLTCLIQALRGKLRQHPLPRWLIVANFIWLLLFITFIIFLNGPGYHQP